jgi:hypothetical protein
MRFVLHSLEFKAQSPSDLCPWLPPLQRTQGWGTLSRGGVRKIERLGHPPEFSESAGGSDLGQVIAHEGSHVEDDMNFLNSYNPATGKYNPFANFSHFDTEFQAFSAGAGVKPYSMFPSGPGGYQQLTDYINRAYPNADQQVFSPRLFPQ